MLSWSPARIVGGGGASTVAKVFTAVVVCVHPCQVLMSIKDGANDLLYHSIAKPKRSMSALCRLPKRSVNTFYPSPLNHSFLVLPYFSITGKTKKACLDVSVVLNKHMVARHLHQHPTPGGDEAVLPPIYSKDPGIPGTLEVGYLGPLWANSQWTAAVPNGGTGLQGEHPAISEVTFCSDEKVVQRSLAQMTGPDVIYSEKWYDQSGKRLENLEVAQVSNPSDVQPDRDDQPGEDPPDPGNKPDEEATAVPVPDNTAGDESNKEDNAKSEKASSSDSSSNSDSEDSSQSSSSSNHSGESDAKSNVESDVPKHKVRWKKKPHQSSNAESDGESTPEAMTGKTGDHSDEEVKRTSHDSGLGGGVTANPTVGSSGDSMRVPLGSRYATDAGETGSLPLPSTPPPMDTLEALTEDLEKFSKKLFQSLEETSLAVYDKVLWGFKDTSGKCKDFIHDMGLLVVTFFAQAEKMEGGLAKCDTTAFHEAMDVSKNHIYGLIEQVANAEDIYDADEAKFNSILVSVAKEVKAYIQLKGEEQRREYKRQCLDRIRQDHGRLDGMCFIPMIVGNLTSHQPLAMSLRVAQSHMPLKIMVAPLCTQAGATRVYVKFMQFLAWWVIALQERLGLGTSMVQLESESGGWSTTRRECSSSLSPACKSSPPSRHGSPIRAGSGEKASMPSGVDRDILSPHSRNSMSLWATLNLSDDDVEDTFTDEENQNCQTPQLPLGKH